MSEVIRHSMNGRLVEGKSGRFGELYNPAHDLATGVTEEHGNLGRGLA